MLFLKNFVIILTFSVFFASCSKSYNITKIEGKQININEKATTIAEYDRYILPYKTHIEKDLDSVLAYNPVTLEKSKGQWQTNIGDFLANVTLYKANSVFLKRENKSIDICMLNNGGIRSIIAKGNITTRTAFEIMPFENTTIVVTLKGEQIAEIANYIVREKKPHPIAGFTFTIDKNNIVKDIKVKNEPLVLDKIYYVATSDYLANGGDNMIFFKKSSKNYDLDYKLRNILIDYFKEVDTIVVPNEIKIIQEK